MTTDRDEELANLLNDFYQRDGYKPLTKRMLLDTISCLKTAREEGRREIRRKILEQVKLINEAMRNEGRLNADRPR